MRLFEKKSDGILIKDKHSFEINKNNQSCKGEIERPTNRTNGHPTLDRMNIDLQLNLGSTYFLMKLNFNELF